MESQSTIDVCLLNAGLDHFPLITGPTTGWRCRAKLAVRGVPGHPIIGVPIV